MVHVNKQLCKEKHNKDFIRMEISIKFAVAFRVSYSHFWSKKSKMIFFEKSEEFFLICQKLNGAKMTIKIEKNGAKLAKKY